MASHDNIDRRRQKELVLDADALELARLGYKQEFKRAFSPLELFSFVFSIFGLYPSIASVLVYALPNGGPAAMIWGWGVPSLFIFTIALSLAELGSAAPTSGGLYYWSFKFASPRWRRLLSWIVGYSNTIGLIAGVASLAWGCALMIMADVSIGLDQEWSASTAQTFGVYAAIIILEAIVASLATRTIARLQGLYVMLNILLCLAIIIAVPAATPREYRNSAEYAFGSLENVSGWPNGFAFVLSFLAPMWTINGFDSAMHVSEEASNARTAVPWTIISATALAGITGFAINIALAFCMGTDLDSIVSSPIGQPMAVILYNSLGKQGTLVIWSFVAVSQFFTGTSLLVAISRQTFAFARDGGLPFSRYLYRINARTRTPVNCAWFAALVALLLGVLAFAGADAISAIFGLVVVGFYTAYTIPIVSRFAGGTQWTPGPFSLGRMGLPVAMVAVAWMMFAIIILVFPSSPHPNGANMNYIVVVFAVWLLICLTYYYFPKYGGVYWFRGPVANFHDSERGSPATSDQLAETKDGIEIRVEVDEKRSLEERQDEQ